MNHQCIRIRKLEFPQEIDDPKSIIHNFADVCMGESPMILIIPFIDKGGTENRILGELEIRVDYCPFCGVKAENSIAN